MYDFVFAVGKGCFRVVLRPDLSKKESFDRRYGRGANEMCGWLYEQRTLRVVCSRVLHSCWTKEKQYLMKEKKCKILGLEICNGGVE
uniref:Uncharacterized protein n=1 Tax=Anopheles dirus TaxID=7168 RepID=A0A182NYG1_9DIPT